MPTTPEAEGTIPAGEKEPPAEESTTAEAAVTPTFTPASGSTRKSNDSDDSAVQASKGANPLSASVEALADRTVGAWEEERKQGPMRR